MLGVALLLQVGMTPASAAEPPPGWAEDAPPAWDGHDGARPGAPADAGESAETVEESKPHAPSLLAGAGLAVAFPRSSEHAELLEKDGYSLGARVELEARLHAVAFRRLALGGYFGIGGRTASSGEAPALRETVVRAGGEVLLVLQPSASLLVLVGPELGVVNGTLSLRENGESQTVAEYGGMAGFYGRLNERAPIWHLGGTLSYTLAPTGPPSGVGRDYDYGGLRLAFTVVLGV